MLSGFGCMGFWNAFVALLRSEANIQIFGGEVCWFVITLQYSIMDKYLVKLVSIVVITDKLAEAQLFYACDVIFRR